MIALHLSRSEVRCLRTAPLWLCLLFAPTSLWAQSSETIRITNPQVNGANAPDGSVLPQGEIAFTCDIQYSLTDDSGKIISVQAIDASDGQQVQGPVAPEASLATAPGVFVGEPPGGTLFDFSLSFQTTVVVTNVAVIAWLLDQADDGSTVVVSKSQLNYAVSLDEITFSNPSPDSSAALAPGDEVAFSVRVTYKLETESAAELIFEVRDQDDEQNYYFESIDVSRADGRRQITIETGTIKIPESATRMFLKARLFVAPFKTLAAPPPIEYAVGGNSIRILSPEINGMAAPNGFSLLPGQVSFKCDIEYTLVSDQDGGAISVQAIDVSNGRSEELDNELILVDRTVEPSTETGVTLSFQVTEAVTRVKIVAGLIDSSFNVLDDDSIEYGKPTLEIEFGTTTPFIDTDDFSPLPKPAILSGGASLIEQALKLGGDIFFAIKARLSNGSALKLPYTYDLILTEGMRDGTIKRGPGVVETRGIFGSGSIPDAAIVLPMSNQPVPRDVDFWHLRVRMADGSGEEFFSPTITIPINRVRILKYTPTTRSGKLLWGEDINFVYRLELNVNGAASLEAAVQLVDSFGNKASLRIDLGEFTDGDRTETVEWSFVLPNETVRIALAVWLMGEDTTARSSFKSYGNVQAPPFAIPRSVNQVAGALGFDLTTLQAVANLTTVTLARTAGDINNVVKALKPPSSIQEPSSAKDEYLITAPSDIIQTSSFWSIEPRVAKDDFVGEVALSYSDDDLSDDPNFSETNLKIVSLDPQSGELQAHETTVDLEAKKATAQVEGLDSLYGLAVVGPFTNRTLNFPILRSTSDLFNGLAFLNLYGDPASLDLYAYDPTGTEIDGNRLKTELVLSASEQLPQLADQFFEFPTSNTQGWVQAYSNRREVVGFELIGSDDILDGVDVPDVLSPNVILTRIEYGSNVSTESHIANPTNFQNGVVLELYSNAGVFGTFETSLDAKEKFTGKIEDIFPDLPHPFLGYLIVRADYQVAAAELLITDSTLAALNAQILEEGSEDATHLYSAQLASGRGEWKTQLNLVNATDKTALLTIRVVGEDGESLAQPVSVTLQPGEQWEREVGQLFGFDNSVLTVGSILIESDVTGVRGDVTFGDPTSPGVFRASLPLDGTPAKFAAFAQVANGAGFFTGFAAFNPNDSTVTIEVTIYNSDRIITGSASITLAPGGRISKLLPEVVPSSQGQVGGYFTLTSDLPVASFSVFGTTSLSALSAVPPQGKNLMPPEPPPQQACGLFGADFEGSLAGWTVSRATWQIVDGKLEVSDIDANSLAEARHALPVPNHFRLEMDIEVVSFDGSFYGFQPFSTSDEYPLSTSNGDIFVDGLGAAVTSDGRVGFVAYDVDDESFVLLNGTDYGAVQSLGIEWNATGVSLIVNGTVRQTIGPGLFGETELPPPSLDLLSLLATGSGTRISFDNICQNSPAGTSP